MAGCICSGWCGIKGLPLRVCFLVVFLQQWPKPGTGLMSLLLTGGGCSTSLGGLVRHTGRAAALIRIPVIPETDTESQGRDRKCSCVGFRAAWYNSFYGKPVFIFVLILIFHIPLHRCTTRTMPGTCMVLQREPDPPLRTNKALKGQTWIKQRQRQMLSSKSGSLWC